MFLPVGAPCLGKMRSAASRKSLVVRRSVLAYVNVITYIYRCKNLCFEYSWHFG